jgi:hypothetical protein
MLSNRIIAGFPEEPLDPRYAVTFVNSKLTVRHKKSTIMEFQMMNAINIHKIFLSNPFLALFHFLSLIFPSGLSPKSFTIRSLNSFLAYSLRHECSTYAIPLNQPSASRVRTANNLILHVLCCCWRLLCPDISWTRRSQKPSISVLSI